MRVANVRGKRVSGIDIRSSKTTGHLSIGTLLPLCFVSGISSSLVVSGQLSGYITLICLVPLIYVLAVEDRSLRLALALAIFQFPISLSGLEGLLTLSSIATVDILMLHVVVLSVYAVFGFALANMKRLVGDTAFLFCLPFTWVVFETITGAFHLWGGYALPFSLGYFLVDTLFLKAAAWSGVVGLSLFIIAMNTGPVWWLIGKRQHAWISAIITMFFVLAASFTNFQVPYASKILDVAVIQSATTHEQRQQAFTDEALQAEHLALLSHLTQLARGASLIVWPEVSTPGIIYDRLPRKDIEGALADTSNAVLGAVYKKGLEYYNVVLNWSEGALSNAYTKRSLVPKGEAWLESGRQPAFVNVKDFNIGLLICMDSIHSQLARETVAAGATAMAVLANSDKTNGLNMHLRTVILRAVETNRFILYASQQGQSAMVTPAGKVVAQSASWGKRSVFKASMQPRSNITPFVKFGNWLGRLSMCVLVFVSICYARIPLQVGAHEKQIS